MNAFCNAFLDKDVYIHYPNKFHIPGHYLQLIYTLYSLLKSLLL
jgi:hypothetical protein